MKTKLLLSAVLMIALLSSYGCGGGGGSSTPPANSNEKQSPTSQPRGAKKGEKQTEAIGVDAKAP